MRYKLGNVNRDILALRFYMEVSKDPNQIVENYDKSLDTSLLKLRLCRLWAEIEAHKWRDLELNLSKTVEELRQDSQLIQANSMKKLRDNKKLLECSFAQI